MPVPGVGWAVGFGWVGVVGGVGAAGGSGAAFTSSFLPSAVKLSPPRSTICQPFFTPGVVGPSTSTAAGTLFIVTAIDSGERAAAIGTVAEILAMSLPFGRSHTYTRGLRPRASASSGAGGCGLVGSGVGGVTGVVVFSSK